MSKWINNGEASQRRSGFINNGSPAHKGKVGSYVGHGPRLPGQSSSRDAGSGMGKAGAPSGSNRVK